MPSDGDNLYSLPSGLIDNHQCVGSEEPVQARIVGIGEQWENLVKASTEKSLKLREANKKASFHIYVKDIEFWLSEVSD